MIESLKPEEYEARFLAQPDLAPVIVTVAVAPSRKRSRADADAMPYLCPHPGCGKTFNRASALNRHMRIHEKGVEPETWCPDLFRSPRNQTSK